MLNNKNIHLSKDYLVFFTLGDGYTKENKTQVLPLWLWSFFRSENTRTVI